MAIKPYLQLIRLPNLFTAAADSLAGFLFVRGHSRSLTDALPLMAASVAIYAGGIVLNDLYDIDVDRVERPDRPLPSGRVSSRVACVMAVSLLSIGMAFTCLSGDEDAPRVGFALIWCVVAYDIFLKRSGFGPFAMGACRGLNLLLGMSGSIWMFSPAACLAVSSYALFVTGITWISRSEVNHGSRRSITTGAICQAVALLVWIYVAKFGLRTNLRPVLFFRPYAYHENLGLLVLIGIALMIGYRTLNALRYPEPKNVQRAVVTGILSLISLHFGMLLTRWGLAEALLVGWLWFPAVFAGRWIYST